MDLSLSKLPWYAQVGTFVVLAVAVVVVFYIYYEKPARLEAETRRTQLRAVQKDIAKGRSTARKLDEFRDQVADLESRLIDLQEVLPEEKDAAELLRSMQNVAVQSSLNIRIFKPELPVVKQLHAEWPIALEIDGTYHNLASFFDRVGRFTRIVNISGLQIEGRERPAPGATISAKCVATTFVLLEAIPADAKVAKGSKGKAGKGAKPTKPKASAAKKAA
jgi:type IV pilus assembly protein PilO